MIVLLMGIIGRTSMFEDDKRNVWLGVVALLPRQIPSLDGNVARIPHGFIKYP